MLGDQRAAAARSRATPVGGSSNPAIAGTNRASWSEAEESPLLGQPNGARRPSVKAALAALGGCAGGSGERAGVMRVLGGG